MLGAAGRAVRAGGAVPPLLPSDGARAAELRNHPRRFDALGEGLTQRLEGMSQELTQRIETACDDGLGMP